MIGGVFRTVTRAVGQVAEAIVETGEEIVRNPIPVAMSTITERSLPIPVQAAVIATQAITRRQGQGQAQPPAESAVNREENTMPHTDGHMPMELPPMRGAVGYESPSEAFIGGLSQVGTRIVQNTLRGLRGPTGGAASGVAGGLAGSMLMDSSNVCGCEPKPFVRFNKCGDPIITRKMKKQAIEAINCNGPEVAAATLTGGSLELLTAIVSKQFPPMRRGISGAQLNNAAKTARRLDRMHTQFMKMCKPNGRKR